MKVKDFIKELQKYDENMEVVIYDREDHTYDNAIEFKQEVESYMIGKEGAIGSRIDKDLSTAKIITDKWFKKGYRVIHKDILVIYADY